MKLWLNYLSFFLDKKFFCDDGSQNMFVYHQTLDTLELKRTRVLIMFLVGNQRGYILLNLSYYILLSYIALHFLDIKW